MDIDQLNLFLEVYRAKGFAPVARTRGVAPSSVSRAIAVLEDELDLTLFQRTTRRLEATDAGEALHTRIAPLIEELENAIQESCDAESEISGRLRVTASVSYGQIVLAPRIGEFMRKHPGLSIDLVLSDARVDLVGERIDIAIRHGALADSSLIARKLHDVRYRLVASSDYLAAAEPIKSPKDLSSHRLMSLAYEDFSSSWTLERGKKLEEISISPSLTVTNAMAMAECTLRGLGIALLADWTIAEHLDQGRLVEVLPGWRATGANPDSALWLVYPTRRYIPAKVRAFASWLSDIVRSC